MTLFIVGVAIALVISALCSVMEATLLSLTPAQVATLSQSRPRIGRIWQGFKSDVERPIAVILLLNTAAHTVGASIAGAQFGKVFGEEYLWLFAAIFTFVMLQFTEILAKSLGVRFNRPLALIIARPLQISTVMLKPILWVIHLINKPFERKHTGDEGPATVEEITALAGLARISNQISPQQERIIATAPKLSSILVRDIMIPRPQVAYLPSGQSLRQAIDAARANSHTRFPVCQNGDLDQIVGYVNVKELLFQRDALGDEANVDNAVRPIHVESPDASAEDLLHTCIRDHVHVAIVQDESGSTLGLVTFEDVVEELIGDIRDEFDRLPRRLHEAGTETWLAGGGIRMGALEGELELDLSADAEQSLAGWLTEKVDEPIRRGIVYTEGNLTFTVRRLRRGSVFECEISRESPQK